MIRYIRPLILCLLSFVISQKVVSQGSMNMKDLLSQKFLKYVETVPREEIYIHTDRSEYISGEDIWFSVYLLDRQTGKPTSDSKVAYFELLNRADRPVIQRKLYLDGGTGPGHILLPDTLSTGVYTIRAYTSWMKNFLPENCFYEEIHIYNAFSTRNLKERKIENTVAPAEGTADRFPSSEKSGISFKTDNKNTDRLILNVKASEKYRTDNNNLLYLLIQTHGNINYVSTELLTGEETKISISKSSLTPGINQITVFDLKGQPVGEKYIYTPDRTVNSLNIIAADSSGIRQNIEMEFDPGKIVKGGADLSSYSVSVSPVVSKHSESDINDYMKAGSEFGSQLTRALAGKNLSELSQEMADSLLKDVKSNWINWNVIVADMLPVIKYQREKEDQTLSGKFIPGDASISKSDNYVTLTMPGKIPTFQYCKTDRDGRFSFHIHIDEKIKDLVIVPDIITKNQALNIESPFSDSFIRKDASSDSVGKPTPAYISDWGVNHQVRKIYGISASGDSTYPHLSLPHNRRFYGKPDQEIAMKDYILLPVMQEVFFELLPGTALKERKSGYDITVTNPENNKQYTTPPSLFIDGVAVKDATLIAGLETEWVEKIDVVSQKYYIGDYLFTGIVNVTTKSGDFSNVALPDYAVRLSYSAVDPVTSFKAPDYRSGSRTNHVPDFRNTLYWNPAVKPGQSGKILLNFSTSDFVSDFVIKIQGINAEGKPVSVKKLIKVRRSNVHS